MLAQLDRRRIHAAAGGQVRAGQQRGRLADDDDALGGRLRRAASSSRSSTTRERIQPPPQQKSDRASRFREPAQERAVDRDVRAHARRTSSSWRCAAARCSTTSATTSTRRDCSSSCRASGCRRRPPRQPDGGHYVMNMLGLILNADRSNVASVGSACSTSRARRHGRRRDRVDVPRDALRQARRGARRLLARRRSSWRRSS